ncbi:MAG: LPS export ABC transporter periplasmic protein LptC [Alphaproteobacteria bacterium]
MKIVSQSSIRRLRLLFLLMAALLVLGVMGWGYWNKPNFQEQKTRANLAIMGTEYSGFSDGGRPYKVKAEKASKSPEQPDVMILDKVEGWFQLNEQQNIELTADKGIYHQSEKHLKLVGHVVLLDGKGTKFFTEEAIVELKDNIAYGNQPVIGEGANGRRLESKNFRIDRNSEIFSVQGKSSIQFNTPSPTLNKK